MNFVITPTDTTHSHFTVSLTERDGIETANKSMPRRHDAKEAEDVARICRDCQQQFSASERFQPVYLLSGVDLSSFCIQQLENLIGLVYSPRTKDFLYSRRCPSEQSHNRSQTLSGACSLTFKTSCLSSRIGYCQ